MLRDVLNKNFTSIHVDDELLAEEIYQTLEKTAPEKKDIVKHYKGKLDIFDNFGINRQIKQAFGKQVMLTSGAYLIVEKTEAMHVIDVNSGDLCCWQPTICAGDCCSAPAHQGAAHSTLGDAR